LLIPAALSVEDTAIVLAEREGRIINLRGQEGQRVREGDVLALFNDGDQRSQLQQARIEVSRLQVEAQQYEALVKLNRSELEREMSLASQGISSKADVERAQYKLDQSVKEYEKTQLATSSAQARVEAVKLELEKSTVRAPITGIITHRYTSLGTNVVRNDKLFEVDKLTPLQIKFQLPQTEKERLSPGIIVSLSRVDSDLLIARARIRRVDPVADATSSTFGYLADIVGGSGLIPGLAVNVHLPRAAGRVSFWIPRVAFPVDTDPRSGEQSTLLVVDGDKCSVRIVGVNTIEGDQLEVITGLAPGDRVILSPPTNLKEGDKVEVKQA
jgi:RND family efflux transporter MFP subunit